MGTITVIGPLKSRKSHLMIYWKWLPSNNQHTETFRNIKSLAAAKNIIDKRNTENIRRAMWNGIDLMKKTA